MKKVISILLAILLLVVNLHPVVAFHFCGGKLSDTRVGSFHAHAGCGMETSDNPDACPNHYPGLTTEDCCKSSSQILKTDDFSRTKFLYTYFQLLLIYNIITNISINSEENIKFNIHTFYPPPIPHNQKLALLATFLK